MGVISRLLPLIASAYGLQIILAAVFVPQANERYFDLGGAAGFLSTTLVSLSRTGNTWPVPRQILLSAALGVWSARLGSFLVQRVKKAGGDSRFDEVKYQPKKFTFFWMAQATWIFLVGLPVYLANTIPPQAHPALRFRDYAAFTLFVASFALEVTADRQKSAWRAARDEKRHEERFISSGLWSISRHPNYVAEIGIWTGIWALASSALRTAYFPRGTVLFAALASPGFTYFLLRKVSGVPPLERAGDKKFGNDPKWAEYKRSVPVFWPWGSC